MKSCPKCNCTNIDCGALYSRDGAGSNYYQSAKVGWFKGMFSGVKHNMYVCLGCGYSETYVDLESLKKKLDK